MFFKIPRFRVTKCFMQWDFFGTEKVTFPICTAKQGHLSVEGLFFGRWQNTFWTDTRG